MTKQHSLTRRRVLGNVASGGIASVVGTTDAVEGLVADRVEFHSCTEIEIENADEFEEVYVEVSEELSGPLIVYYSLDEFMEEIDGTTTIVTHEVYPYSETYHGVDSIYLSEDGESPHPDFNGAIEENRYENPFSSEECLELKDWEPSSASIVFRDQESDGTTVVIDEIERSHGGFVALHDEDENPREDPPRTASSYLDPGTHSDVTIELADPLLVAAPYHDLTDDRAFNADGDEPYLDAVEATWEVPSNDAFVTIERDGPFEVTITNVSGADSSDERPEVTTEVTNTGACQDTQRVQLFVGETGELAQTQTVTLRPDETKPISLAFEPHTDRPNATFPVSVVTHDDEDKMHRRGAHRLRLTDRLRS
ncbi:DUF7282 domain-containing protein [Natrialbaceae archaeon A-gly3]